MNKKILIPIVSISIGALAMLSYFLIKKKKRKINIKELKFIKEKLNKSLADVNLVELKKNLNLLLEYDW
jgi:hypothetical protein